ncbi:MAG: hypothetical protein ACIAS6_08920 [Phycisphaerales bacterium JB060]
MRARGWSVFAALASMAGAAMGQNEVIFGVGVAGSGVPDLSTAPSLAVGQSQVVVMGSHQMMLFDKSVPIDPLSPASLLDSENWGAGYSGYPFEAWSNYFPPLAIPGLTFPRADYDPITGNVWLLYSEATGSETEPPMPFVPAQSEVQGGTCVKRLHLAASKHSAFDTFDTASANGFEYVTGTDAVNLGLNPQPFAPGGGHGPFGTDPIYPSFGFDTDDVFIAAMDAGVCTVSAEPGDPGDPPDYGQTILVLPREFGSPATTIHDGGIPQANDFTIIRMSGLRVEDPCFQMMAVQEPYEQYGNVTLFISTNATSWGTGTPGGIDGIRLRGVYRDSTGTLQVRQSLEQDPGGVWSLNDADIAAPLDDLIPTYQYSPPSSIYPETPSFDPTVENGAFHTALLTKDNQGNPRVFAAHAALDDGLWAVQWYVIDPAFGPEVTPSTDPPTYQHFHAAPLLSDDWEPTIVAAGRITQGGPEDELGHCYHPVLGVSRTGQLFIEYTFSEDMIDQKIVRATISNSYSSVAAYQLMQSGPTAGYDPSPDYDERWALYGDMQTDPTACRFWSTHTLVDTATRRDVWLFAKGFGCFQTDMNLDGGTDPIDMMEYTSAYMRGDRRADTDADMVIDAADLANFVDAYDAATGP